MQKIWFKAKRTGWGWTPVTWEGWLVTLVCSAAYAFGISKILMEVQKNPAYESWAPYTVAAWVAAVSYVFILICYRTGEKPEWPWRSKK